MEHCGRLPVVGMGAQTNNGDGTRHLDERAINAINDRPVY